MTVPSPIAAMNAPASSGSRRKRHHWIVRVTHWVNVVALTIMVTSGLRIFNAYPAFARRGETFCCWPWEGQAVPAWLTFGGWLAGARNWHFAMMWVLAVNGAIYVAFIWLHGEWRDLAPRRGDLRDGWEMVKFYLFARKTHPRQGKHNALQKTVYFALPWLGLLAILTGMAIWKPVQLAPLTGFFGGYVWVRYWHFMVMLVLVLLATAHVVMVFAVDPQSLRSMITGRYDESRSPEALNARPFVRRPVEPVLAISRSPTRPNVAHAESDLASRQDDPPHDARRTNARAASGDAVADGAPSGPAADPDSRDPSSATTDEPGDVSTPVDANSSRPVDAKSMGDEPEAGR